MKKNLKRNKKVQGTRCGGTEELKQIKQILKGDKRYKVVKKPIKKRNNSNAPNSK